MQVFTIYMLYVSRMYVRVYVLGMKNVVNCREQAFNKIIRSYHDTGVTTRNMLFPSLYTNTDKT